MSHSHRRSRGDFQRISRRVRRGIEGVVDRVSFVRSRRWRLIAINQRRGHSHDDRNLVVSGVFQINSHHPARISQPVIHSTSAQSQGIIGMNWPVLK